MPQGSLVIITVNDNTLSVVARSNNLYGSIPPCARSLYLSKMQGINRRLPPGRASLAVARRRVRRNDLPWTASGLNLTISLQASVWFADSCLPYCSTSSGMPYTHLEEARMHSHILMTRDFQWSGGFLASLSPNPLKLTMIVDYSFLICARWPEDESFWITTENQTLIYPFVT